MTLFGLVIPGFPLITELTQIGEVNWMLELPAPNSINTITVFLTNPLPEGMAAALSFTLPPYTNIEFLGAIANTRPSDTFNTSWALNPEVNTQTNVRLLISLEPIATIASLVENKMTTDMRQEYAKKVALNLFRFMESFNQNTGQYGEFLVLPSNIIDKWLEKFEFKFKFDPNFVFKTE